MPPPRRAGRGPRFHCRRRSSWRRGSRSALLDRPEISAAPLHSRAISPPPRSCRSPARQAASRLRAAPRASIGAAYCCGQLPALARSAARPLARGGRRLSSGPWRKAILPMQRQPRCALTRSTMSGGRMLRLQREGAFDAQHQSRRPRRRVGIAPGGARRPLHFDRPAACGDLRAGDFAPVGHQARLAEALARQSGLDELGEELAERRSRRSALSSPAVSSPAFVPPMIGAMKRHIVEPLNLDSRRSGRAARGVARLVGPPPAHSTLARASRASRRTPIASGCPKSCCSRRRCRRRRLISSASSRSGRASKISPPPRLKR